MQDLHRGQQPVLTVGRGNAPLLVAGATTFPPAGGLYSSLCVSFILPPLAGEVRRSRKGGGERSEPIRRMLIMSYDIESKSRNADFISIARRAIHNPRPERPSNLRTLRPSGRSIRRTFPSEPFEPSEPSEPSRRRRVHVHVQEHNFSPIAFPKRGIIKKHITKNFRYENRSGMPGQLQGEIFC